MALTSIDYAPGQDSMQDVFDKTNDTIDKVNQIDLNITGGTTSQILVKASATDYDYEWQDSKTLIGFEKNTSTAYTTETTIITTTPSISKGSANMKFSFQGYIENGGVVNVTTITLKKNGSPTKMMEQSCISSGEKQSVCLIEYDTYAAGDIITVTAECSTGTATMQSSILTFEAFDAV